MLVDFSRMEGRVLHSGLETCNSQRGWLRRCAVRAALKQARMTVTHTCTHMMKRTEDKNREEGMHLCTHTGW